MLDYGGVLPWTRWVVAVTCLVAGLLALPLLLTRKPPSMAALVWPIAFGLLSLFLVFQAVPLPESVASWLSPASTDAYNLVASNTEHHPVSVAPWLTRLSITVPAILGITALIATFCTVQSTRLGGAIPSTSAGSRFVPCNIRNTRSGVGGTTGNPSVQPRS